MASDDNINPQLLFHNENTSMRFSCGAPVQKAARDMGPPELRYFPPPPELRRDGSGAGAGGGFGQGGSVEGRNWRWSGSGSSSGEGRGSEEEEGLVGIDSGKSSHTSGGSDSVVGDKNEGGSSKELHHHDHASFGSSDRQMIMKSGVLLPGGDGQRVSAIENGQHGRVGDYQKVVTVAEHDAVMYYSQLLSGTVGPSQVSRDISGDNGCGFSGRKEVLVPSDPAESLRAIFCDPITGALMDDAMILPCGHSFGGAGIQQVIKMKACYTCSRPISEDSAAPNLSLRAAVQAFRREEDSLMYKASKRRRERFEQDKGNFGDPSFSDTPRGRGVQFPFAVMDRVIIKGNKRTPQRFVGREAIVTTQCLNGWYVVKTMDNAESVKVQYRSLEKVPGNSSSKPILAEKMTPNCL